MFGPIGMPEMVIIMVIALIVFGPRKLPELGRSLGRSLGEFKRASNELRHTLEEEVRVEDRRDRTTPAVKPTTPIESTSTPAGAPAVQAPQSEAPGTVTAEAGAAGPDVPKPTETGSTQTGS